MVFADHLSRLRVRTCSAEAGFGGHVVPSATDYERAARTASARAAELRELARTIRSIASPISSSYDSLHARHLEGIWLSEGAHRSRVVVASQRARCRTAAETSLAMAAALEQRATSFDADARTAARRAEAAAEENRNTASTNGVGS